MNKQVIILVAVLLSAESWAANYPLEIIQPQPSLTTANRYYKAYPGLTYEVPIGVFGGLYPFTYALTANATCDNSDADFSLDADTGIITWTNPTTDPDDNCTIEVTVTDAEESTDTVSWTVDVTTTGFIFVDSVGGTNSSYNGCESDCGDGTIANPFLDLCDIYVGTGEDACNDYAAMADATYADYFVYFRAGTYEPEGYFENSDQQYQIEWRTNKPTVWLAYPGETVIIDHNAGSAAGAFFDSTGSASNPDMYVQGIKFQDMLNHAFRIIGNADRTVFYDNTFYNGGPGIDGQNSSFIMFSSTGGLTSASYKLIKDNTFDTQTGHWAYIKTYSTNKTVLDGNIFTNPTGTSEGVAIKASDQYVSIRDNYIDGAFSGGSIAGNWASCSNMDISFNNVLNAFNDYDTTLYGALVINYHDTADGPVYMYRNTLEGTVTVKWATSDDGPFYLYNNVIVNENAAQDVPDGSYITHYDVDDPDVIILGSGATANLVGSASDAIIDANGDFTEAYSAYIGSKGHMLSGDTPGIGPVMNFNILGTGSTSIGGGTGSTTIQ